MAKRRDSKSRPGGSSPSAPVNRGAGRPGTNEVTVKKIVAFFGEVKTELGKVSWSTREEVFGSTMVVIVLTAFMALFIGVIDLLLSKGLSLLFR